MRGSPISLVSLLILGGCSNPLLQDLPEVTGTDPFCGDGKIDPDEECDDGLANADKTPDACRTDCTLPLCGDRVVDSGEECDDGPGNTTTCDYDGGTGPQACTAAQCGDSYVNPITEQCDTGGQETAGCDFSGDGNSNDCTRTECDDGYRNYTAGEVCDDDQSPTAPGTLRAIAAAETFITLGWDAATDDVAVKNYKIYRSGQLVASTFQTTYTNRNLIPATQYAFHVTAVDAAGNESLPSNAITATTLAVDAAPPTVPTGVEATAVSATTIRVDWVPSIDDVLVIGYRVYRDDAEVGATSTNVFTDTLANAGTVYSYEVAAFDAAGNESLRSPPVRAIAVGPPSVPSTLRAKTVTTAGGVSLSWQPSLDDDSVASYRVFRDETEVGTPTEAEFADTPPDPATTYTYTVVAVDNLGNESAPSATTSLTTLSAGSGCGADSFKFAVFGDSGASDEAGLERFLAEVTTLAPEVRFYISTGDTPSLQRIRGVLDTDAASTCIPDESNAPWFPTIGDADTAAVADLTTWANAWATPWDVNPQTAQLAQQLPGLANFARGPTQVNTPFGLTAVNRGSVYSFDYGNAHFVLVNSNTRADVSGEVGYWDFNSGDDPTTSQIDWLRRDLANHGNPLSFAFGHIPLLRPCYGPNSASPYPCVGPSPPGHKHPDEEHPTGEVGNALADANAVAYFHGHNGVPGRMMLNRHTNSVYQRLWWEVANDPEGAAGTPADWQQHQSLDRFWQVGSGSLSADLGHFTLVSVTSAAVDFEAYTWTSAETEVALWDTWSVPTSAYCDSVGACP